MVDGLNKNNTLVWDLLGMTSLADRKGELNFIPSTFIHLFRLARHISILHLNEEVHKEKSENLGRGTGINNLLKTRCTPYPHYVPEKVLKFIVGKG